MLYVNGMFAAVRSQVQDWKFIWGRRLVARVYLLAARTLFLVKKDRGGVDKLLSASRLSDGALGADLLKQKLDKVELLAPSFLPAPVDPKTLDERCLVLAEPRMDGDSVKRKGVLLVSFTETGGFLFSSVDRLRLFELFHIVLEPSWAGYAEPSILCWLQAPDSVIVQTPERRDRELLEKLETNLHPVEYGAGDWIDPERFSPAFARPFRGYNTVSVANFGWWKRNHAFIKAVGFAARRRDNYRAALVLAGLGKSKRRMKELHALIGLHGLEGKLDIVEGLNQRDLNDLFSYADALVFTSWKEGSSRVIYEAMCADCPVLVLARNMGVNKKYINPNTGRIVNDKQLGKTLASLEKARQQASPRKWFVDHLGPRNTTRKLTLDLARLFPTESWSMGDLMVKGNIPEARLLDEGIKSRPMSYWVS